MAPAMAAVKLLLPPRVRSGNAPRFPRPRATVPCRPAGPGTWQASARPGGREAPAVGGRALAGGFGPRLDMGQRGAVAGAMAPAIEAVKLLSPLRAETGNASRFPARARRCPVDRQVQAPRKASARPGGREAPATGGSGAGRGLWPPAGQGAVWHCGRGDGPCHCSDAVPPPFRAGTGNAPRFPPARDGALWTGRSGNSAGQRPTRRACGTRSGPAEEVPAIQPEVHAGATFQQPVTSSGPRRSPPVFMAGYSPTVATRRG
jgi:hypothetical protein